MNKKDHLGEKIRNRESGILTYGITPPKKDLPEERIAEIAAVQTARIRMLDPDALVVYDLQDEKDRNKEERPFPFLETIDPSIYDKNYLSNTGVPSIVYRCVGKYTEDDLRVWVRPDTEEPRYSVFVGAASAGSGGLTLSAAYQAAESRAKNFTLGAVLIPERHRRNADEHLRAFSKTERGVSFFISQAVYSVEGAKDFLSDYAYLCRERKIHPVPILFTLTPCGSEKTLSFMKWLGIAVPRWLENELLHSNDILQRSVDVCAETYAELDRFGREMGIPVGCNVESVSTRKLEIEASVALFERVRNIARS